MRLNRVASGLLLILAVAALSMVAPSSYALAADAPVWSTGFPRLVEKNVLLQWDPVKGAAEYKVYKTTTKDKDLKLIATSNVNRHIDKDVASGKTFFYYVTAVADGKEGPRSAAGAISTPVEKVFVPLKKPKLVGGHVKTAPDGTPLVGIRWEDAGGTELIGINIYRSTTKGKGYTLIKSVSGDTYEDEEVKPGKTYYYVASSVDSNFKETGYSNEISVEVPALVVDDTVTMKVEAKPTRFRTAKLLFRIPVKEDGEEEAQDPAPGNAADVVVDEAVGHIYVSSSTYGGVMVYDMQGRYQFGIREDGVNGDVSISGPTGMGIGPNGDVYLASYNSDQVHIFEYDGKPRKTLTVDLKYLPELKGRIARAYDVAVDRDGRIVVTDPASLRVHVYDSNMRRLFDIAPDKKKNLEINGPSFVTLDKDGNILYVDSGFSRIQVFDDTGRFTRTISKKGRGAGQLFYPMGISVSPKDGMMFNASGMSPNVQAFTTDGNFMYALSNEKGDGPIDVASMKGIFVDSNDRIYIAEGIANRVSVFQMTDKYVDVIPPDPLK